MLIGAAVFSVLVCFPGISFCQKAAAPPPPPQNKVAPHWPKELPNNWVLGQISGMAVDSNDHIWVVQRPGSDILDEIGADPKSPRHAMCCVPAPPVLVFDAEGNLLKSWGGPGKGYDWPESEHGILVEKSGNVWIGGNAAGDRQILQFTNDGKFLKQIGHPSKEQANTSDTTLFGRPAGFWLDEPAHELYVSDGYLNRRVIVFDSSTLAFKRMWGAYGNTPNDADPGPYKGKGNAPIDQQFRSPVHCVKISNDGLVYVCDRANDRVQVFTKQGKFLKEFFVHPETLEPGTVCDIAFSRDPGQEYLLVEDNTDMVIWTLRRSDGAVVGMFGHNGRNAGQFHSPHQLVSDSAGNLYTGEVETGKRIQKFLLVAGK
jgi:DNA-binding beta-propeller fold protein YncE